MTTPGAATQWLATFHLPPRSLRLHVQTCVHCRNRPAQFKNELKRCFSENKTRVHAAALFDNLRKQEDNENLRSYIHKYSKLHREATGISCEEEFDTQKKLHFLSRLRNSNISVKISQSAEFEKFDRYSLTDCMEKALLLESRLQIREMVTQAREAVDAKTPEVMEVDAKIIEREEEINTIPEDKPINRSKATSICFKCGDYGHYGKECTVEDKDLEEFANKIVGRIEHTFQAYTPITLQYMNDIVTKAAKLDQSRRIAKTKARLLQGLLNQRGGAKGVPKTPPEIEEKVEGLKDNLLLDNKSQHKDLQQEEVEVEVEQILWLKSKDSLLRPLHN